MYLSFTTMRHKSKQDFSFLDMPSIVTFIVHGQIKRKRKLILTIDDIFGKGFIVKIKQTSESHRAGWLTTEAIAEGTDYLVAVGGDGTVNEVVNAHLDSGKNMEILIGIIPLGRGNDFVKSLGIQKNMKSLLKAVQNNSFTSVDVGWLTFYDANKMAINRYFINIADIGLGGLATQMIRTSPKYLGPNISYAWAIFKSLLNYKSQKVKITTPEWSYEGEIMSACMANGKYFGSGLCIAPDAKIDDGIAEIVLIGNVGIWDYLSKIPLLKKGKKINHPEVYYKKAMTCMIESQTQMPIDIDGEFVGYTPLKMVMKQKMVKILV
ncbi:YegS/Rv2252/BmrU family lipid kinase [Cyclobacteriaceae bacterium YHN15]|nr:YegS/Rv2252/BmrU family lipid kinase [Cyclobacteriaceae bacterium YHN15]